MRNAYIIIGVIAVILAFIIFTPTGLFTITGQEGEVLEGFTCQTDQECVTKLIESGFPQNELNEQLEEYNLFCNQNSMCAVVAK